jgi:hypothetical protein
MALKDLVLSKTEIARRRKARLRPAEPLPNVQDATLEDIHREVNAAAQWATKMGYRNVAPRLEWAARALLYSDKL